MLLPFVTVSPTSMHDRDRHNIVVNILRLVLAYFRLN